jgi:alpha-maltose-1-phosphate synthase
VTMRIIHYTRPCYLDHSLSLVHALSQWAEVHLMLELSPEERIGGMFGEQSLATEPGGVHSADAALRRGYLAGAEPFLANLASFNLVVHRPRRAFAVDSVRSGLSAAAHVRALRPDILHIEERESVRALPLFLVTPGIPKLLAIHDAQPHPGEAVGWHDAPRRLAASRADHLLFYSRFSQALFATHHAQSSVVPLGVKEVFRSWLGEETPERSDTLLFFGRIAQYKGLEILYQALPRIAERVPHLRVLVVGRPAGNYANLAPPALPASVELVTRFETVDAPTLRCLFQQATIVVLPYLEASQSGVVQTAYAFAKPVVASAVGGLAEVVRDGVTGRLVAPGEPEPLAQAIAELLLDSDRRASMHQAIQEQEETQFGWHVITQQLRQAYESTICAARIHRG